MSIKLFIGTSIAADLSQMLWSQIEPLGNIGGWRWIQREQWHITSLFIGQRDEAEVEMISSAIESTSNLFSPITLSIGQLKSMPEDRPTMLWVRFTPSDELSALHRALARATSSAPSPHQPHWPHITLARGAGSLPKEDHTVLLPSFTIYKLTLFRSDPGPNGTVHTPLGMWPLGTTNP